ncbi:hypothetical protein AAHA92_28155 [Salvia divinorum]|uniref:Uncharacterized protein n=1 Tax=Salvia divinorum TaxID=28513 RepID=A0ABD1FWP6_SALDI
MKEEPGKSGEGSNRAGGKVDWGRSTRFEFPKFDGEGFEGWVMRSDYFFEEVEVPEGEKVRITALHLEGKVLQWHRGYVSLQGDRAYGD